MTDCSITIAGTAIVRTATFGTDSLGATFLACEAEFIAFLAEIRNIEPDILQIADLTAGVGAEAQGAKAGLESAPAGTVHDFTISDIHLTVHFRPVLALGVLKVHLNQLLLPIQIIPDLESDLAFFPPFEVFH